jgi:hypothetical protein
MEFRSGKTKMTVPIMGTQEVNCWMAEGKIYLYMDGDLDPVVVDINDDGTLQTPFGEMKKRVCDIEVEVKPPAPPSRTQNDR